MSIAAVTSLLQAIYAYKWCSIICVLAVALFYDWWIRPHKRFPPGARGYLFLGVLPYLGKHPEYVIAKWSREIYGPIMSLRFARNYIVYINNYDALEKAFISQSSKFLARPPIPVMKPVFRDRGYTFSSFNNDWKVQRNFLRTRLSRSKEEIINRVARNLLDLVKEKDGKAFDIHDDVSWFLSANITLMCFGRMYERANPKMTKVLDHFFQLFTNEKTSGLMQALLVFPSLKYFPPFKQALADFYERTSYVQDFVDEEISFKKKNYKKGEMQDFVDEFLEEQKKRNGEDGFDDEQLRIALFELLFGGTENTANTLSWGFLCLLYYPETQKKLHQEISSLLKNEEPSMEHCDSMPYTMAFLQELFRFRTISPFGNQRMTSEDVEVGGYFLPKNTTVSPNLWAIHNDPDLWEDPHIFKPERHLDDQGRFVFSKKIVPFSVGGRSCPGEKFARQILFLVIVHLLQNFEILPDPESNELPCIDDGINGAMYCPYPFKLVAKPRIQNDE